MVILLVDDDLDVIEGIMDGVDFEALGFQQVFCAQTSKRAKEILCSQAVSVMLTDIEMPGGSGLALLEWVRDNGMKTVTVFYTAFANFDYAQKAIELHCFAYFLKPIPYDELKDQLIRAGQEARRLSGGDPRSGPDRWDNQRKFWGKLLLGELPQQGSWETVSYPEGARFTLCACTLFDDGERLANWKKYALRNVLEELAGEAGLQLEALLPIHSCAWCGVFWRGPLGEPGENPERAFLSFMRRLGQFAREYLRAWLNCFYASGVDMQSAPEGYCLVKSCLLDNVTGKDILAPAESYIKEEFPYNGKKVEEWGELLANGEYPDVEKDVPAYLEYLAARGKVNMPYIKAMRIDLMQTIHTVLKHRQISAHDLFSDERFDSLRADSLFSIEHMKRYLCYVVHTAGAYMEYTKESGTVVGKMKEYIRAHFHEEVTRNTLAKEFFLNPDYLARLFKKEAGLSIGGYLQEVRVREAKSLLANTALPVNEVALRVGYDNISYFSRVFREKTGLAPIEYRRKNT